MNIVWFKRDLRTEDHRPLARAAGCGPVLPLYIVEPDYWAQPDHSARQFRFVRDCLAELRSDLAALGQPLVIRVGGAVEVLEALRQIYGSVSLFSHQETGNAWTYARDLAVGDWCKTRGIPWTEIRQDGVIRRMRSRNGWAEKWDAYMSEPVTPAPSALPPISGIDPGRMPELQDLWPGSVSTAGAAQRGGRSKGLSALQSFLYTRGEPYQKAMSSPVSAPDACSRLSPHLAFGSLSVREVAQSAWARQREIADQPPYTRGLWPGAMRAFIGRLHWRCHFMQKLEDEPRLELEPLHRAYAGMRDPSHNPEGLEAWCTGQTGYPFVDACMRSLNTTGWINFRMRAMLMAVASYHLWLDWRATGEHMARQFTDYEPGIHWSQIQMQSGTTGINTVRVYNPLKQGYTQDPTGAFIRSWIPELADVPGDYIHEPWAWGGATKILGSQYPDRVFDHERAARAAKERIYAIRKSADHRAEARSIASKHGSRKSGMNSHLHQSRQGPKRKSAPKKTEAPAASQLRLFD